jgi:photosystem II stability/assembly factor-like uncharacterized protein
MRDANKFRLFSGITFVFILLLLVSVNFSFSQSGWYSVLTDTVAQFNWMYFTDSNTGYAVGFKQNQGNTYPRVMKTTNAGINWFAQATPYGDSMYFHFRSVFFTDANTGFLTAGNYTSLNSGGILKTTNGGYNWFSVPLPVYKHMIHILFVNSSTGYATGYQTILKTTDSGLNWSVSLQITNSYFLAGIYFNDINTGYVVGNAGRIFKTTNGGEYWYTQYSPYPSSLWDVWFTDTNTGFIVGGHGTNIGNVILRTTNAGIEWLSVPHPYSKGLLYSVRFTTPTTGYIMGNFSQVLKTTNSGLNWHNQIIPVPQNEFGISCSFFTNLNTGYIAGGPIPPREISHIFKTTDGGGPLLETYTISGKVKYADNNQAVSGGYVKAYKLHLNTLEFETIDSTGILPGGDYILPYVRRDSVYIRPYPNSTPIVDWIPTFYPSSMDWIAATKLIVDTNLTNIDVGVIRINVTQSQGTISGNIYKPQMSGLNDALVYAKLNNVIKGYAISGTNGYYIINNVPAGIYNVIVNRPGYYSDSTVIESTGGPLNNINFTLLPYYTSVKNISTEIPEKYQLWQNYPNPFNSMTNVRFQILNINDAQLIIYDLLGREVATLVNKKLQPGIFEVLFEAGNLPSGVYLYKLTTGEFTETKKMLIIK